MHGEKVYERQRSLRRRQRENPNVEVLQRDVDVREMPNPETVRRGRETVEPVEPLKGVSDLRLLPRANVPVLVRCEPPVDVELAFALG